MQGIVLKTIDFEVSAWVDYLFQVLGNPDHSYLDCVRCDLHKAGIPGSLQLLDLS